MIDRGGRGHPLVNHSTLVGTLGIHGVLQADALPTFAFLVGTFIPNTNDLWMICAAVIK